MNDNHGNRTSLYDRYSIPISESRGRHSTSWSRTHDRHNLGGSRRPYPGTSSSSAYYVDGDFHLNNDENHSRGSQRNRRLLYVAVISLFAGVYHVLPRAMSQSDGDASVVLNGKDASRGTAMKSGFGVRNNHDGSDSRVAIGGAQLLQSIKRQPSSGKPLDIDPASELETGVTKKKKWNPCANKKYELERHDYDPRHGDICRVKGGFMGLYECPEGCHETGGAPPYCAKDGKGVGGGSGPCRARDPDAPPEYRCDDGNVCVMAVGSPKEQFKGEGNYYDDSCDNKCGDGRSGETESWNAIGRKCNSDWDCSLAGICNSDGVCECDPWADGVDCSYLKFQPVDRSRLGYIHEKHTSWGGSIIQSSDGSYHMYVSEILCKVDPDIRVRCGLSSWQTHSRVVKAKSYDIDGPYRRLDSDVLLHPEHHNPTIHKSPKTGKWHLFTISGPSGPIERMASNDEGKTWSIPMTVSPRQNPGPVFLPDGSAYLFYRADGLDLPSPTCSDEGISVQYCPSESEPCKEPNDIPVFGHTGEDPSVFIDHRGNYHMLFNALPYKCVPKHQQGGHAWSKDGVNWSTPRVGAFDTTIKFTDGTRVKCERRERPQMVLGKDAKPLAMVSAVTGCPKALGDVKGYEDGGAQHYRGGDDSFTLVQKMSI